MKVVIVTFPNQSVVVHYWSDLVQRRLNLSPMDIKSLEAGGELWHKGLKYIISDIDEFKEPA